MMASMSLEFTIEELLDVRNKPRHIELSSFATIVSNC